MDELIELRHSGKRLYCGLLASVSGLALLASVSTDLRAAEDGEPTVWIELGGQLERVDGIGERFTPAFTQVMPIPGLFAPVSPVDAQKAPGFSYGAEAKATFLPKGSDWFFSVELRYGRSSNRKHVHQQTAVSPVEVDFGSQQIREFYDDEFADTKARNSESHTILDFGVGRDVGLGLFGKASSSHLGFGVRFAQFSSNGTADIKARPDIVVYNGAPSSIPSKYFPVYRFHAYTAFGRNERSFHGIGPSLSWDSAFPLVDNGNSGLLKLNFGVNGSVLFGRQKALTEHQTSHRYLRQKYFNPPDGYQHYTPIYARSVRSRNVAVPNIGGSVGLSFERAGAKVTFGYRADLFFGAVDGGMDSRKSYDRNFYGPFAKVSIGLGG